jgi:hypothetical protein
MALLLIIFLIQFCDSLNSTSVDIIGDLHTLAHLIAVAETDLKIFIYERPENLTFQSHQGCPAHFYAEKLIPEYFRKSHIRTYDPNLADYFLVEHNFACIFEAGFSEAIRKGKSIGEYRQEVLWSNHLKVILEGIVLAPYFQRNHGHNHLIVFTYDTNPFCLHIQETMPFFEKLRNATFLLNFGVSPRAVSHTGLDCLRRNGVDIVLPQFHTFSSPPDPLSAKALSRPYDSFFKGSYSNCGIYDQHCIRPYLEAKSIDESRYHSEMKFYTLPGAWQKVGVECAYFSLCPSGFAPWSVRMYDSLYHDTIPVLLSNGIVLPFERFLNWSSFIMKVDTNAVYQDIVNGTHFDEHGLEVKGNMTLLRKLHEYSEEYRLWVRRHFNEDSTGGSLPIPYIWTKLHSIREALPWFDWNTTAGRVDPTTRILDGVDMNPIVLSPLRLRSGGRRGSARAVPFMTKSVWSLIVLELWCRTERGAYASSAAASRLPNDHPRKSLSDYCSNSVSVAATASYP